MNTVDLEIASRKERCVDMAALPYPEIGNPGVSYQLEKDTLLSDCWFSNDKPDIVAPKGAIVTLRCFFNYAVATYDGINYRY